jgi:hypothetical protein
MGGLTICAVIIRGAWLERNVVGQGHSGGIDMYTSILKESRRDFTSHIHSPPALLQLLR